MTLRTPTVLLAIAILISAHTYGQKAYPISSFQQNRDSSIITLLKDTSVFSVLAPGFISVVPSAKSKKRVFVLLEKDGNGESLIKENAPAKPSPLLKVHGNIYYDVYYQSNIDTPYFEKDLYQHTIRTYLDVTVKDNYPLRVGFSTRFSNSGMLRNITGLNLNFNSQEFKNAVRNKVTNWLADQAKKNIQLEQLKNQLEQKKKVLQSLEETMAPPSQAQKIIEQRELAWLNKNKAAGKPDMPALKQVLPGEEALKTPGKKDTVATDTSKLAKTKAFIDSTVAMVSKQAAARKQQYDSLKKEIAVLEKNYQALSGKLNKGNADKIAGVKSAKSSGALNEQIGETGMPDSLLPKGYKTLMAVKSFGIGRTFVDYSELSAKNISITGVQLEYNPKNYYAIASGFIDYRYRDFIISDPNRKKQYLNIIRYGKGDKDGNNIIFTYYTGKKQLYNYISSSSDSVRQPGYSLMGITVEGRYKVNENIYATAEVAKSSAPYYDPSSPKQNITASTFDFKDRSNEAYALKLFYDIPATNTKLSGSYKKLGAHFQSFSLFNSSSEQRLWSARVDQQFFKKRLSVMAAIRTNDFTNPYLDNNYYSKTIFKSLQATLRIRKYPVLSLGYFPSTQLIKLSNEQYIENLYNTLVGTLSHFYTYKGVQMNTSVTYTRFYNRAADSNFVYFNTTNLFFNHSIFLKHFTIQTNLSSATNTSYNLYVADGNLYYKINDRFGVGAGIKYNRQTVINNEQLGYSFNTKFTIPKLGEFQLLSARNFIPGMNKQLVKNDVGRLTYIKIF